MSEITPTSGSGSIQGQPQQVSQDTQDCYTQASLLSQYLSEYQQGDNQLLQEIQTAAKQMQRDYENMQKSDPKAYNNPLTTQLENNLTTPVILNDPNSTILGSNTGELDQICTYL